MTDTMPVAAALEMDRASIHWPTIDRSTTITVIVVMLTGGDERRDGAEHRDGSGSCDQQRQQSRGSSGYAWFGFLGFKIPTRGPTMIWHRRSDTTGMRQMIFL